eukprot:TRINITY_DN2849_c0_g1_i5.p1 TRINITY_DN2849_c0_g1~~TRINITY_DN2849_c0_g1_i5.p1  ORF type:complete len:127 (-),score=15.44 TRINITY_DN2849_c0_g1_i5:475-855(-)
MEDQWDYTRRPRKNECRELYLPGRNLERVDLDDYEQLDTLWVNNNKIKSFTFLQPCFRLRCLFAQNNQIKSLENLGSYCRFLVVLLLQVISLFFYIACLINKIALLPKSQQMLIEIISFSFFPSFF